MNQKSGMNADRLSAFTDGVVAIIITIMVLELKVPRDGSLAALSESMPILLAYVIAFINVGLYWNNHHHLMQAARCVDGRVLWANLFLLFWLSLVPFVIRWQNESDFAPMATAAYGVILGMAAVGYSLTERAIIAVEGQDSTLAQALGSDRKEKISLLLYVIAVPLSFYLQWLSIALYILVILLWLVPDRRIERTLKR